MCTMYLSHKSKPPNVWMHTLLQKQWVVAF
jgi:hypothetical protein